MEYNLKNTNSIEHVKTSKSLSHFDTSLIMNNSLNQSINSDSILWGLWLSRIFLPSLGVADKINLFSCINNGYTSIETISQYLGMHKQGIEALICFLTSISLLNYSNNEVSLTTISKNYLLPESLCYW
ncbi:MAG TPA: hypothetical protein PKD00_02575, partial [Burkholderiales bacterium]|nr:hypothetical protein [Burkholderiales bacterium]